MPASPQIATWFILFAGLGQVDGAFSRKAGLSPQGWAGLAETYVLGNAAIHFQPQNRSSPSSLCMHSVSQLQSPISIYYNITLSFSSLHGARTIFR
ncbi:Mediator of RNA polymerase II transcription subunit 18 [Fusarium oxysporum f. sp. albedinis]|nr:Mediator of RNA polymerase II transcription subunit 18 [Fusarium oxysporum f. sp. albedinis]